MAKLRVNNRLWLISDTHFGHRNIVKFCQRPESHEAIMLSEWIKAVGETDQILHLGDVFLGPKGNQERWASILSRMPGRKFLIKGNHDRDENELYWKAGFEVIEPFIYNGHAFTHRPASKWYPAPDGEWHTNIHGHIHNSKLALTEDDPDWSGGLIPDKTYINVSVEVFGLKPRQLGSVW